eukprot:CAMPEP_0205937932 /NCGR_PEP_ID=MMETSP1325-20131115/45466_1 /ASSEMBLY_ACC=CAM_ASM_000708 /TAXON_ID=236786 /ORGANISM="Florenciella sp., Strain RCC1007" /LENGTH=89 /DNA_ID=CAMNT_0053308237 /DNA_START=54 /DNA_END=321 /DNA_ORIENTATION=-
MARTVLTSRSLSGQNELGVTLAIGAIDIDTGRRRSRETVSGRERERRGGGLLVSVAPRPACELGLSDSTTPDRADGGSEAVGNISRLSQ